LRAQRSDEKWAGGAVAAGILIYVAVAAYLSIRKHAYFQTAAFDLGIFENALFNTVQGHGGLLYSSLVGGSQLGVHPSFILLALVPLYTALPTTETLLVAQSVLIGFAAWPLFRLARALHLSPAVAAMLAATYLLHPSVAGANLYDFHELAFFPILFFSLALAVVRGHWLTWPLLALALTVKEDTPVVLAGFGLFLALWRRDRGPGLAVATASIAALFLLKWAQVEVFGGQVDSHVVYFSQLAPRTGSLRELVSTLVFEPGQVVAVAAQLRKLQYLAAALLPFGLLALFSWRTLPLVAYGVAVPLLASSWPLYSFGFQYGLYLVCPALVGATFVLAGRDTRSTPKYRRAWIELGLAGTALVVVQYGLISPLSNFRGGFHILDVATLSASPTPLERSREVLALIPPDASVVASEFLVPHVARRAYVQTLRYVRPNEMPDYLLASADEKDPNFTRLLAAASWTTVGKNEFMTVLRRVR
jgi:uncharacterized membrane protein